MRASKFYLYQVTTGNLSRVINSIGQYEMMIENLKKSEETKKKDEKYEGNPEIEKQIEEYEKEVKELEIKERIYIMVKEDLDKKFFSKYYKKIK